MKMRSHIEKELESIDKVKLIQLPTGYKKIGWIMVVVGFITLLLNGVTNVPELTKIVAKYVILLGLFSVSISREIIEDERIKDIRMQSYFMAFITAIIYAFLMPFTVYILDGVTESNPKFEDVGDFVILWILLAIQIFYFNLKKRVTS
ncbi:MAG: hypothetical protein ACI8XB_000930 [Patiriisocius sp.]|jgi:hypothetical protein